MQGTIGVETTAGAGSTFWVELPRAESQLARLDASGELPAAPPTADTVCRRGKILYVEDNLSNLTLMQRLLARHGRIELIPAMSGGLALDLARLHRPDLVLLDLHLPDIPGEEVLSQLRQDATCRSIPVVVLSADATQVQIQRLVAAGAHAYLTKPLVIKSFIALLDEVLDLKEAA
jgi:CheY-like chemotaxis protein